MLMPWEDPAFLCTGECSGPPDNASFPSFAFSLQVPLDYNLKTYLKYMFLPSGDGPSLKMSIQGKMVRHFPRLQPSASDAWFVEE